MNFICAAMSGVGAIVQAKRERERERGSGQAGVRAARQQEAGSRKAGLGSQHIVRRQGAGGCWPGVRSRRQGVSQNRD